MNSILDTQKKPLVSVIIPSYNYFTYLETCINSVLIQRAATFELEVIVVDDGSTDNTGKLVARYPDVHYVYQENQGLSAARNRGIEEARGEYLLFLDADDLLLPGCLAAHITHFMQNPELEISIGLCLLGEEAEQYRNPLLWQLVRANHDLHLCRANISPVHTFMLRKSVQQDVGFFKTELAACEDYNFWLRCADAAKRFGTTPEALVLYRKHSGSMSKGEARLVAADALQHFEVMKLLRQKRSFPAAGTYLGWFACAAGYLGLLYTLPPNQEELKQNILEMAEVCLRNTLRVQDSFASDHGSILERFFLCHVQRSLTTFALDVPKGVLHTYEAMLQEFHDFKKHSLQELDATYQSLFAALCFSVKTVQANLKINCPSVKKFLAHLDAVSWQTKKLQWIGKS